MPKANFAPRTITVWKTRSKKPCFHVVVTLEDWERKAPFKFYFRDGKITTSEKRRFGVLFKQICSLIRQCVKEQGKVSAEVKMASVRQYKKHKRVIPKDAYYHQLRCEEAGACD